MAAILRVKRRINEEPLDALIIACKRPKIAEKDEAEAGEDSCPVNTIAKFAGTIENSEDNVVEHLVKTLGKDELEANFKQHPVDILKKLREVRKKASADNRYRVVNCHRSLDTSNIEEFEDKVMTLIDAEDIGSVKNDSNKEEDLNYVYDLYYAKTESDMFIDNMVSVHTLDQQLVFDTYRNGDDVSDHEHESDDSNSESNWRNDYPDSDHSEESTDTDDMRKAVWSMRLEEGSDLSSEDDFVYAVNEKDVEAYGYKYAKYKARVDKELRERSDSESSDDDSEVDSE